VNVLRHAVAIALVGIPLGWAVLPIIGPLVNSRLVPS